MNALVLAALLASNPVVVKGLSQASGTTQPVAEWGPPVSWREGAAVRRAWADPGLLAELRFDEAGAQAVRSIDATASASTPRPLARLWAVKDAAAVLRALPEAVAARFAPVLRDAPTTAAAMRVCVGGVVVAFEVSVPAAERHAWLVRHGVTASTPLGASSVRIPTVGQAEALRLANALAGEPGVALAVPDFWRVGVAK